MISGLLLSIFVSVVLCDPVTIVDFPMKYVTNVQYTIDAGNAELFKAKIACTDMTNFGVEVCAELPNNWQWSPFRGLVNLRLYNDTAKTGDPSQALLSSNYQQCMTLDVWPGGDLYVRVDPNNYAPVVYTINVNLKNKKSSDELLATPQVFPRFPFTVADIKDGPINELDPVASTEMPMTLEFGQAVTLQLNLCFAPHTGSNIDLVTSVLAQTGVYTQFICNDVPCLPDVHNIGSQNSPLPVGTANAGIDGLDKVYVTIFNAGGEKDPKTGKVLGTFRFGATITRS